MNFSFERNHVLKSRLRLEVMALGFARLPSSLRTEFMSQYQVVIRTQLFYKTMIIRLIPCLVISNALHDFALINLRSLVGMSVRIKKAIEHTTEVIRKWAIKLCTPYISHFIWTSYEMSKSGLLRVILLYRLRPTPTKALDLLNSWDLLMKTGSSVFFQRCEEFFKKCSKTWREKSFSRKSEKLVKSHRPKVKRTWARAWRPGLWTWARIFWAKLKRALNEL